MWWYFRVILYVIVLFRSSSLPAGNQGQRDADSECGQPMRVGREELHPASAAAPALCPDQGAEDTGLPLQPVCKAGLLQQQHRSRLGVELCTTCKPTHNFRALIHTLLFETHKV